MQTSGRVRCGKAFGFGVLVVALGLTSGAARQNRPTLVTSEALGGKERYLTCVATDKPIYRGGEKVYIRAVALQGTDHTPASQPGYAFVEIKGPKGETVASGHATAGGGAAGYAWTVPDGQAGGEYVAKVTFPSLGSAPGERKFDVRAYRAPRIKTQIRFLRDGYGPNDTVAALLEATRAEGGAPANAKVNVTARVDGRQVHAATVTLDDKGNCTALFKLPAAMERGEGTVAFAIEDGGVVETATKTIPILLQTVDLSVYPEGGDLVAGLPCRVYVEGKTPAGKPADLAGVVVDAAGAQAGTFRTEHEGRGRFVFTPKAGAKYALRIVEPSGIAKTFPLPDVKPAGVLIRATQDVYAKGRPVTLRVLANRKGPFKVTLSRREQALAEMEVKGPSEDGAEATSDVTLTPPASADGALIATVRDSEGVPVAERLIFREPSKSVRVEVEADRPRYVPGGKANLTVKTLDQDGRPVGAVVGLAVTDDSVLEMIEKREQAPRLPVMFFLEPEVRELADAHVYLDAANPKAPLALDLLLGTQGWRRFATVRAAEFLKEQGDKGRRALAMRVVTPPVRSAGRMGKGGGWDLVEEKAEADGGELALAEHVNAVMAVPAAAVPPAPDAPQDAKPRAGEDRKELVDALLQKQLEEPRPIIAGEVAASRIDRRRESVVVVREYAHRARADRKPNDRLDFAETLYWHAGIQTDEKTGVAQIAFDLSDAVTSFRVCADAFTAVGALGEGEKKVESVQPFYAEPKLPLEVTMGDRILLPVGVVNGTTDSLGSAQLRVTGPKGIQIGSLAPFTIGADARVRQLVELAVGEVAGKGDVVLDASAGAYSDRVTRPLSVVPRGFPVEIGQGGVLKASAALAFKVTVPKTRVPDSVRSQITVYPSPLANLTEALERLIQEPYGCFEQTSSTTYPLVMAQQYFLTHQGVDPKLIQRSRDLLDKGYKRLIGYECKQKGYEWFGEDPGHEALTAYGLLEFTDMAKVQNVDPKMLERTRAWLLGVRDGQGGFKRERRALHTWMADKDASNAYITWALLAAGEPVATLGKEIDTVKAAGANTKDTYVMALAANVAALAGDKETVKKLGAKLAALQTKEGDAAGAVTSIVGSGGESLQVETTSLALLAWLTDPSFAGPVESGMKWLSEMCKAGRFGSTQATVLALRAILAYDAARSRPKAPGAISLTVDGRKAGSDVVFDAGAKDAIKLTDIAELLEPGEHTIEVLMKDGSDMPCSVAVNYSDEMPATSAACKLALTVGLSAGTAAEGGVIEANVTVQNKEEDAVVPTPIAIIGIPGGLEVRHDQLKELVKAGRIAAYEVIGRDVVLYWRELQAGKKVQVPLSLVAAIPGTYVGPASRAYLYYTDEHKVWADPLKVVVAATSAKAR